MASKSYTIRNTEKKLKELIYQENVLAAKRNQLFKDLIDLRKGSRYRSVDV